MCNYRVGFYSKRWGAWSALTVLCNGPSVGFRNILFPQSTPIHYRSRPLPSPGRWQAPDSLSHRPSCLDTSYIHRVCASCPTLGTVSSRLIRSSRGQRFTPAHG